jgi:hypothetical protein
MVVGGSRHGALTVVVRDSQRSEIADQIATSLPVAGVMYTHKPGVCQQSADSSTYSLLAWDLG